MRKFTSRRLEINEINATENLTLPNKDSTVNNAIYSKANSSLYYKDNGGVEHQIPFTTGTPVKEVDDFGISDFSMLGSSVTAFGNNGLLISAYRAVSSNYGKDGKYKLLKLNNRRNLSLNDYEITPTMNPSLKNPIPRADSIDEWLAKRALDPTTPQVFDGHIDLKLGDTSGDISSITVAKNTTITERVFYDVVIATSNTQEIIDNLKIGLTFTLKDALDKELACVVYSSNVNGGNVELVCYTNVGHSGSDFADEASLTGATFSEVRLGSRFLIDPTKSSFSATSNNYEILNPLYHILTIAKGSLISHILIPYCSRFRASGETSGQSQFTITKIPQKLLEVFATDYNTTSAELDLFILPLVFFGGSFTLSDAHNQNYKMAITKDAKTLYKGLAPCEYDGKGTFISCRFLNLLDTSQEDVGLFTDDLFKLPMESDFDQKNYGEWFSGLFDDNFSFNSMKFDILNDITSTSNDNRIYKLCTNSFLQKFGEFLVCPSDDIQISKAEKNSTATIFMPERFYGLDGSSPDEDSEKKFFISRNTNTVKFIASMRGFILNTLRNDRFNKWKQETLSEDINYQPPFLSDVIQDAPVDVADEKDNKFYWG